MLDQFKKGASQPTARQMAQVRLAVSRAGIPESFADVLATSRLSSANYTPAAKAVASVLKVLEGPMRDNALDLDTVKAIIRRAVEKATAEGDLTPEELESAIDKAAREIALSIMAEEDRNPAPTALSDADYILRNRVPGRARNAGGDVTPAMMMADAMLARMNPRHTPTHGRQFVSMRLEDMARIGRPEMGIGAQPVMNGLHTTGDFAAALGIASNKILLDSYALSESQIKRASREVSAPDFRPINTVRVSTGMGLDKVNEAGQFTYGTINDAGEAFAVETYGKVFGLSRQALVNDDLGALSNSARIQGAGAALTEARLFASLLEKNAGLGPVMQDGKTLFHADHGNTPAAGSALSVDALSEARLALRRQKGLSGEAISVQPAFLIVPPELETMAETFVAVITAAAAEHVNPFSDRLEVIVDANLTNGKRWYLAATPGLPDGLLHAYLDGAKGPQLFTREGFEVDSMEFKVRLDFGCGFADHRAWFMNPGPGI